KQQKGRLREHFQLNMDIIGEPGPLADTEIIGAAIDIQRALGMSASDVRVRLSDRRVLQSLLLNAGVPEEDLGATYAAVDKIERAPKIEEIVEAALVHVSSRSAVAARVIEIAR